jgi:hypothetical protein
MAYLQMYREIERRVKEPESEGAETVTEFDAEISETPLPTATASTLST